MATNKQAKHTATYEWHESNTGNHQGLIVDAADNNIAVTYEKANAPIIVRAVNSHEALVKALKAAYRYADFNESPEIKDMVKEAIAQAEEGY